jgi:hypothetical protein
MKKTFYTNPIHKRGSKYDIQLILVAVLGAFGIALGISWIVIYLVVP